LADKKRVRRQTWFSRVEFFVLSGLKVKKKIAKKKAGKKLRSALSLTCCVWLVTLARSKILKENEPEENPQDFPSMHRPSN
jgi:hypothetical protein